MATSLDSTTVFPADWNSIADADGPYGHDPMHFPFPISPLMASIQHGFGIGHTTAAQELGLPERAFEVRVVNHYRFERVLPAPPAGDAEAAAQAALAEARMQREVGRMLDRWFTEHRPRLVGLNERLRHMHARGLAAAEVLALLDEADELHREAWTIHFRIAFPMLVSMQLLREMHAELFDDGDGALTLMAGSESESIRAGFGLADLAQRARELGLTRMIAATPVDQLMPALRSTRSGQAFLIDFNSWLDRYGLRQDLFDVATPTWRENPAVALASVRSYLETGHDPRTEHAQVAAAAETAFEAARARLAKYPAAVWEQFEQVVQVARQGAFLQEEHNFYIDQQMLSLLRFFYLEVGEHLRDLGLLERADDVFMLHHGEIRALVGEDDPALRGEEARALIGTRRDHLARAAALVPPPVIGDPAAAPPPPDTPLLRGMAAFFGWVPPQPAAAPGQLRGTPGSRGVVSGLARVARTLAEAKAVQPGEVLVTVTTMPAWTPLFGIAAAVVTETGGPLSHCAVVAREYGIPAVVGAHGATRVIATGQRVTVDGGTGVVIVEP
jgi:pyruvate,water dikinase